MSAHDSQAGVSRARLSAGTRLNGIYEIDRPIGMGGMGEIYIGRVIETGDPVAIKVLLPEFSDNAAALTLFRKEASALHHVHHDAVIRYYVFSIEPVLGRPYLAMEFVDGRSLSDILHGDGALTFEAVRSLGQRLASGLQAAHDCGIVHRDVSPDNIIIPSGNVARAKIIDFGIARSTQHGTVIGSGFAGKFNYVSPEQLGLYGGDVTARSDIYSLALVLVHALTGRPVDMGGSQVEIVEKRRKLPDLGAIDLRFRPLLEKMLQPDPANRLDSMHAVANWQFGAMPAARRGVTAGRPAAATPKAGRARKVWMSVAAAVPLIALIGAAGAYFYFGASPPVTVSPPAPARLNTSAGLNPGNHGASTPVTVSPPPPARLDNSASLNPVRPTEPAGPSGPAGPTGPAAPAMPGTAAKIRDFVDQYSGGDCFFLSAVAISDSAAALEGFGASTEPFTALDADFRRKIGFEADIGVRQVTKPQCPAIAFLDRLRRERSRAPRVDIDRDKLSNGEVLSGMVDRYGDRNVDLVLISDAGMVQNVSQLLKPGTDARTFKIGMQRADAGGRQPQLLIAIASASPLASIAPGQPVAAEDFFRNVLSEAARSGRPLSATGRYFMLEGNTGTGASR
jgi:serine/threonine protein kinase, bacterial